jgi:hypothetical protein
MRDCRRVDSLVTMNRNRGPVSVGTGKEHQGLMLAPRESPETVLGEVVVAYVALRPETSVTVEELHALCAERLAK